MVKLGVKYFVVLCVGLAPLVAVANPDIVPSIQAVQENTGTFVWVFALSMLIISGLGLRMLHLSDKNNTAHWNETRLLRKDLTAVEKELLVLATNYKHAHGGINDLHLGRAQPKK